MADIIQVRRDTEASWASSNPVLAEGEMGYEKDTKKMKIGDGSTDWNSLAYSIDASGLGISVPLGSISWWPGSRSGIPSGTAALDGQELSRATYPNLWDLVNDGKVASTSEANWQANPEQRGKFSTGDGSTTFRLPDFNGAYAGSIGAVTLVGDGDKSSGEIGKIREDAMQRLTGEAYSYADDYGMLDYQSTTSGVFDQGPSLGGSSRSAVNEAPGGAKLIFDSANSPDARTDDHTHATDVTGVWIIQVSGATNSSGAVDMDSLATDVATLESEAENNRNDIDALLKIVATANIDMTPILTINSSSGFSSIVRDSTGTVTFTFTTAMPNDDYIVLTDTSALTGGSSIGVLTGLTDTGSASSQNGPTLKTPSSFTVSSIKADGSNVDTKNLNIIVVGA